MVSRTKQAEIENPAGVVRSVGISAIMTTSGATHTNGFEITKPAGLPAGGSAGFE